jgi:hypothetical protein
MLKYILAGFLFISTSCYSQVSHRHRHRIEGFSVKTDVLLLFNSLISLHSRKGYISGELYFAEQYSANLDFGFETDNSLNSTTTRIGGNFRKYFNIDDCNCTALFAGLFFNSAKEDFNNVAYIESGFTGGFQALLNNHFVIDPAIQLGLKFPTHYTNEEVAASPGRDDVRMQLRIMLGVGYRF